MQYHNYLILIQMLPMNVCKYGLSQYRSKKWFKIQSSLIHDFGSSDLAKKKIIYLYFMLF